MVNDDPKSVYKYFPPDRMRNVLEKMLIRFTQASALNDALEFKPAFKGMGTRADVEQGVRERFQTKFPEFFTQIESLHPPEKAAELIAQIVARCADAIESPANCERSEKELYEKVDENFGVLSLSETPSSILMWSHYAEAGRGSLIGFDAQHSWFQGKKEHRDSFRHLRQVKYLERNPAYFLDLPEETFLYTKGIEWSYEKEWRIIRNFNDAAAKVGPDG